MSANSPTSSKFNVMEVRQVPQLTKGCNSSLSFSLLASTVFRIDLPASAKAVKITTGGDLVYAAVDEDPVIPTPATSPAEESDRATGVAIQTPSGEFEIIPIDLRTQNSQIRLISAATPTVIVSFL